MKKFWTAIAVGCAGATALILANGYGFIFRAAAKNISKGPTVPSIDDLDEFPHRKIQKGQPRQWSISENYNLRPLPKNILENLSETKAAALLVIKDNEIVHEKYWNGHHPGSRFNSFSIAKGILSILVGCAIKEGKLRDENQLISDFLPYYSNNDHGKRLTFKHLMTMQAGFDWKEEYHHPFAENSKQYFVKDLTAQMRELKFTMAPGRKYEYQSAAPQVLGLALSKAIGSTLSKYLEQKIWQPLQMEYNAYWSLDEKGTEKAFCCIHATARDFAKIGKLILDAGKLDGLDIINEDFYDRMLSPTPQNDAFCYTIWANRDGTLEHRFFYGFLGQFIIVIPSKQMIIVKFGHDNDLPTDDKLRPTQVNFLAEELCKIFS